MKYQKTFYVICGFIFALTLSVFTWIVLNVLKVISSSSGVMLLMCGVLVTLLFLSFCCACILRSFYEDWQARSVKKNAKWHR